jgi:hypothetical protein
MQGLDLISWLKNGNALLLAGAVIMAVGLLGLVHGLFVLMERLRYRQPKAIKKSAGMHPARATFQLMLVTIVLLLGLVVIFAGVSLKTYQTFTKEKLVARVECLQWDPQNKEMLIRFTPIKPDEELKGQVYSLFGDMWEVNAHILKWTPKVNLMGIHTGYRLNQLKGIYETPQDERDRRHMAYALQGGRDWLWWTLTQTNLHLPLVEAVYGNAVSRPARGGGQYDIYVTTSGLIAKPAPVDEKGLLPEGQGAYDSKTAEPE